jgi:predicted ATPase with chaperone activity
MIHGLSSNKIVAMNPCLYGRYGDIQTDCTCAYATVTKYQKCISGTMLDRIDIHIEALRGLYKFCKLQDQRQNLLYCPKLMLELRGELIRWPIVWL